MVPQKVFSPKASGGTKIISNPLSWRLRDAGHRNSKLGQVSSIFPPGGKRISKEEGVKYMKAGSIRFCVMSRNATNEPNRLIAASVRPGHTKRQPAIRLSKRAPLFRRHRRKGGRLCGRLGGDDASHDFGYRV